MTSVLEKIEVPPELARNFGDGFNDRGRFLAGPARSPEPNAAIILSLLAENQKLRTERDEQIAINDSLDRNMQEQRRLFHIETHDLRGPITAIIGYAQLLQRDWQKMDEDTIRSFIGRIIQGTWNMDSQLTKTLIATDVRSEPKLEIVPVRNFLQSVCIQYTDLVETGGIVLNTRLPDQSINAYTDPRKLRIALNVFIVNAYQAMAGRPDKQLSIGAGTINRNAVICVKDNGKGMSPEVLAVIGQDGFSTKGTSGKGLFMAIQLIEKDLGGKFSIESELDKGTTVTVSIPLAA